MLLLNRRPARRRVGVQVPGTSLDWSVCSAGWSAQAGETTSKASASTAKDAEVSETPMRVARIVRHAMTRNPKETAFTILQELSDVDRIHLVLALQAAVTRDATLRRDTGWADELARRVGAGPTTHTLTRSQVASALEYQRVLTRFSSYSDAVPTWRQLLAVGIASGVPFVGFGMIDNGIMITAGEQIDMLFGARLGISTLASAALGNIVADTVGVGVTQQIQSNAKRLRWAAPPRLSTLQQSMRSVRLANVAGAVLGVTLGCLLGMAPLLFMDPGLFDDRPRDKDGEEPGGVGSAKA